jgi:hypothetical protein
MRPLIAIVIALLSFLYLLPFAIALGRGRTNTGAIFALNVFLGWTLLGWVVALVWAVAHDQVRNHQTV